jgi:hypothetical protein
MSAVASGSYPTLHWAKLYHQGMPVATCPIEVMESYRVKVVCGPLHFLRHTRLAMQLSPDLEDNGPGSVRVDGIVEETREHQMSIRLETSLPGTPS